MAENILRFELVRKTSHVQHFTFLYIQMYVRIFGAEKNRNTGKESDKQSLWRGSKP